MRWRLRRATAEDASALSLVAAASFLETFAGILSGEDMLAHIAAKCTPERFTGWIADPASIATIAEHPDGAAPVGYTLLTTPEDVGPTEFGDVELRRIYALSFTRGTGLGAAMMAHAISDARSLGATRMLLGVLGINHRACDFYERQGFVLAGERRFKVGATWHDDRVYGCLL